MKSKNIDQQLFDKLKSLPKVEDHRDKDELFQRISSHMNHKKVKKRDKLIPVFSSILVVVIFVVMVPVLMNLSMSETSQNNSAGESVETEESSDDEQEVELEIANKNTEQYGNDQDILLMDNNIESYVIQNVDDHSTIIYGAVTDHQLQSVIPISIIIPKTNNLNLHYNQMEAYIDAVEWGVNRYLFQDTAFDIDLSNHEVVMQIPDTFSIGDGSANAHIFNEILTNMFTPYQIKKIVFDEEIELGSIGNISELPLINEGKESYNFFQADKQKRKFLVPLKTEENATIEEAFEDMKKGQEAFNVFPTIPEEVEFSLTTSDNQLIITPDNDQVFEDEQIATIMIEAILMTAKSFGYEFVTFNQVSVDQVGSYVLSELIHVPEAINPIYQ